MLVALAAKVIHLEARSIKAVSHKGSMFFLFCFFPHLFTLI